MSFFNWGKIQMEEIFTSWWNYQICWNLEIISVIKKKKRQQCGVYKETLLEHKVSECYSACTRNQQRAWGRGPGDGLGEGFSSCASVGKGPAWRSARTFGWAGLGSLTAAKQIRGSSGKIPAHVFEHRLGQLLEALPWDRSTLETLSNGKGSWWNNKL